MTRSRLGVAAATVTVLLLGACAGGTSAGGDETTIDDGAGAASLAIDDVDGTSWTLLYGEGPDGDIAMIDGWPVTLTFNGSNVGGTAACNGYGGSYRIDRSMFQLTDLGQNQMGCEAAVQEVERMYLVALQDVDGINLVGEELALSGPATELIFRLNTPAPMQEVTATVWLLEALLHDGAATPVAGEPATLVLQANGSLTGGTGCRTVDGTFIVSGNQVVLNNFSARGDCPISLRAQDSAVVTVLGDGFVPTVDGDELLLNSQGNQGLRYRATSEDEIATLPGSSVLSDADLLDGVEWVFAGGSGPDGPIADPRTVGDGQITLVVSNGTFSGMVNCNSYSGQAEIGSGRWTLIEPFTDEQGCGRELDAIAAKYLDALPAMSEFGIDAGGTRLTTNGNDIELSFERSG